MPYQSFRFSVYHFLIVVLLAAHLQAQPADAPGSAPTNVTPELIQKQIEAAKSSTEYDEVVRSNLINTYNQILLELATQTKTKETIARFKQDNEAIPDKVAKFKNDIAALPQEVSLRQFVSEDVKQVKKHLSDQQQKLDEAKKQLASLEAEQKRRDLRRREGIAKDIIEVENAKKALRDSQAKLDDLHPNLRESTETLNKIKETNLDLKLESYRAELAFYESASEALTLELEFTRLQVDRLDQTVKKLQAEVDKLERASVKQAESEATSQVSTASKELIAFAESNRELATKRTELVEEITSARKLLTEKIKRYDSLSKELKEHEEELAKNKEISDAKGQMLWKILRRDLSDERQLRIEAAKRKDLIYEVSSTMSLVEKRKQSLQDLDPLIEEKKADFSEERGAELEAEIRTLFVSRKKSIDELEMDYKSYHDVLLKLNVQDSLLINEIKRYKSFISEQVFWIRSIPPLHVTLSPKNKAAWLLMEEDAKEDLFRNVISLTQFTSSDAWLKLSDGLTRVFAARSLENLSVTLIIVILCAYRWKFRGRISKLGDLAEASTCLSFRVTLEALTYSLLRPLIWPLVLGWISWNLFQLNNIRLARSLALALSVVAILLYSILLWQRIVRSSGLAPSHFGWSDHVLSVTRRGLRRSLLVIVPATGLFCVFREAGHEQIAARLCFVVGAFMLAAIIYSFASPAHGVAREFLSLHREGWLYQTRGFWFPLLVSIPLFLAILSILGYQYTASQLAIEGYLSVVLISLVYLVAAIFSRWLLIRRRSLAIQQARERQAALTGGLDREIKKDREDIVEKIEQEAIDLSTVNLQSKRILWSFSIVAVCAGLYLIWIDVLPALSKLDEFKLFRTASVVQTETPLSTTSNEAPTEGTVVSKTVYEWITLGNVLAAIVIVVLTVVATQNIPGLMGIAILQRLPLDAALRFAITTLTRYIIIILGMIWAFGSLGVGWSKVQWLAAAVSVGLGFGLQEIFANFISGLILLFERPLRAGDIVTVGETSGRVVQIKTRATVIQDWDRKELIVPNKEFITGRVLNWTLSDTVNRIVITVGIAYGSNIAKTKEVILKIAKRHPLLVNDPEPSVTFELFGDSTLNFNLRAFFLISNMDKRLSILHELNSAIHDELSQAGIEIAFPQRDLHIRSIDVPLTIAGKSENAAQISDAEKTNSR